MKTKILKADEKSVEQTAEILRKGGICVYPTETCYGLGCDATNKKAIKKIRKIKKIDNNKKISIIVSDIEMMKNYGIIPKRVRRIIQICMPAPLTIVVNKRESIPDILNKEEIAFRIPNNIVALKLAKKLGKPITATSANITKNGPIYNIEKVIKIFDKKVDVILDAGNLSEVDPSTIIDMKDDKIKLIREGPVKLSLIKKLNRIKN